jgi:hypothetical protein
VTITTTAKAIAVTRTGGIICGAAANTAIYTGSTTFKAFVHLGGFVSNGTVFELLEANPVDVTVSK